MARFQRRTWSLVGAYYEDQRGEEEVLVEYVFHFGILWDSVRPLGVSNYDGIVRLIGHLPELWKEWAEATARHFLWRRHPSYELDGDMMGFVQAMISGLLDNPEGPPPAFTVAPPPDALELPPWTFLGRRDRDYDEDEDPDEEDPEEEDPEEEDPEEEAEIVESEDDEQAEEEETEPSELAEIEFIPPLPVGPSPEIPPPPSEPFPEDLQQPLYPENQAFYARIHECIARCRQHLADMTPVQVAPEVTPEPPQTVVIPEYPEELLSPIGADAHGTRYGDPVWISSDSDSDEDHMEYEGWVHSL